MTNFKTINATRILKEREINFGIILPKDGV